MFKIKIFEDLDGKGVKYTGGYESLDRESADKNWAVISEGERKPGSYAVYTDNAGGEIATRRW